MSLGTRGPEFPRPCLFPASQFLFLTTKKLSYGLLQSEIGQPTTKIGDVVSESLGSDENM